MPQTIATATDCPSAAVLEEHARDTLSAVDAADVDRHIEECRGCLTRFIELSRQPLAQGVSDCHIVKEIGRGRFGVVYKAWWLHEKPRIVALKLLHSQGEMERNRFDREIAVLKKLDSPWIVKCLDAGAAGDAAHFVMEFVEGVHLDDFLNDKPRTLDAKLGVLERICRAVADAHASGVVHRDLKPRNILIDERDQPHILDFGICSVNAPDWSSAPNETLTHPGDIIGTLRYMSPEQAWGGAAGTIDHRCDIWALGIMLHEIVTNGGYPYSLGSTPEKPAHEALIERIRKELPRIPRLNDVPRGRDLRTLLERSLAWDPQCRLHSAAVLADDLHRVRENRPITTRPLPVSHRAKRVAVGLAVRSRWAFAAALTAVTAGSLWFASFWGNVGWHVRGTEYDRASSGTVAHATTSDVRDGIVVAGVQDDTAEAVVSYAAQHGLVDVSTSPPSWRAVHAHLMHRLVDALPRAVLWDYYFEKPKDADAELAAAATALELAGVPVIFAAAGYDAEGRPNLSPTIASRLGSRFRHGTIDARDMVQRPGEIVMAKRLVGDALAPSAALVTLAALLHPECRTEFEWSGREPMLTMLYEVQPGAYLRARDRIELSRAFHVGFPGETVPSGPLVGCTTFGLTSPSEWETRVFPYERLLTCELGELRARVAGRIVLVGDLRTPHLGFAADRHRVAFGAKIVESVPGVFLLGDAVAGLLDRRYVKAAFPLPPYTFGALVGLCVLGCLLPIRIARVEALDRPTARKRLSVALCASVFAMAVAMLFTRQHASVHVGMGGIALLVPAIGTFWVEFARNRHRVHDRRRRKLEALPMSTGGTVTLPMRTRTLFPEIR